MSEPAPRPARCRCGASPATRRWNGQPVCAGCHRTLLRESFAAAARKVLAERRVQDAFREIADDARKAGA